MNDIHRAAIAATEMNIQRKEPTMRDYFFSINQNGEENLAKFCLAKENKSAKIICKPKEHTFARSQVDRYWANGSRFRCSIFFVFVSCSVGALKTDKQFWDFLCCSRKLSRGFCDKFNIQNSREVTSQCASVLLISFYQIKQVQLQPRST